MTSDSDDEERDKKRRARLIGRLTPPGRPLDKFERVELAKLVQTIDETDEDRRLFRSEFDDKSAALKKKKQAAKKSDLKDQAELCAESVVLRKEEQILWRDGIMTLLRGLIESNPDDEESVLIVMECLRGADYKSNQELSKTLGIPVPKVVNAKRRIRYHISISYGCIGRVLNQCQDHRYRRGSNG